MSFVLRDIELQNFFILQSVSDGGVKDKVEDSQPPLFWLSADTVQCMLAVKSVDTTHSSGMIFHNGFGTVYVNWCSISLCTLCQLHFTGT